LMPELYEHLKNGRHDRRRAVKKTVNAQPAQKRAWPFPQTSNESAARGRLKAIRLVFAEAVCLPGAKKKGSAPLCTKRSPGVEVSGLVPTTNQLAG